MSSEPHGDEQFKCEWVYLNGGVFVTLFGELDTASAPVLRDCLAHLVNEGATHLEIDVSELEFIDSTGLTVVMEQWHRLQPLGGSLYLLFPAPAIQKMLDITGLAPFLLNADPAGLFEGRQVTPHTRDELRLPRRGPQNELIPPGPRTSVERPSSPRASQQGVRDE